MRDPQFTLIFILSFFMFTSCDQESLKPSETIKQTRKDSSFYYFEKGKNSEAIREKISNFNKALQTINHKSDTLIPDILDYKIYYHNRIKEYDSSLYFSDSLITTAKAQQDSSYTAKGYYRKSAIFSYLNQNEKVFKNAFKARQLYVQLSDSSNAGRRTSEMAIAQSQMTDYYGAQQSATEALKYLPANDSNFISSAYNTIATTYRAQGFYNDAIAEWKNAIKYATKPGDSLSNLNNIALALQDQKKYDQALEIFQAITQKSTEKDKKSYARFLDNSAYTKWLRDSTADIKTDLLKAMEMRLTENDKNGLLASYDHLSEYYRYKDAELSKLYANRLLETAEILDSKSAQLNALQKLIQRSSAEKIRQLSVRYIRLNDSLNSENIRAKNTFAKIKFDEEQKQKEIDDLETQASLQTIEKNQMQNRIIILSLGGLLILVSGGFGFYYLRQKHKKEKIQEAHLTETRISKKIHDELANDVYNVMSGMQSIASMMDKLENIYKRTRNISRENSSIPMGVNYLPHLISTLSSAVSENTRLILRGEDSINWSILSSEKKIILYRVLQEMMINMNKHSQASLVAIIFSEEKNLLKIQYSDNGVGVSKESLKSGNGIQNVENRIFSIKGKLNFETEQDKGLKILIQIPI